MAGRANVASGKRTVLLMLAAAAMAAAQLPPQPTAGFRDHSLGGT
jgi:hypothetical protein